MRTPVKSANIDLRTEKQWETSKISQEDRERFGLIKEVQHDDRTIE